MIMKKLIATALIAAMVLGTAACGAGKSGGASQTKFEDVKGEGVMTHAEYMAAPMDSEVVIEAYVQGKQSWWDNKATLYLQDQDGAYFVYEMNCSEEDYAKIPTGTKIKVTGYKTEWSGEVEIASGSTFEIEDGQFIATPEDVTSLLGSDSLIDHQNEVVSFKDLTVADKGDGRAFFYNWDNSGVQGDDLYFDVTSGGNTYTFTVESYLTDKDSDVYKAVEKLSVGDKIDCEGFLYWYEGVNPHITKVTVK
ncbi:MAG: hypothetical protein K6C95_01125 [Lachnospiraceae bacterium]|nr:hypothetical protein [Lachnospiraceae bacterium]